MANQPKKYKKFVATAATATLVASAIVPVASAAEFKDVTGNDHAVAINALADAGIIKGFADGTFKPNQTVTRGQVVKLLGRWLEAQGQEIPSDWKTEQRFNDLPTSNADSELVQYAALAKDAGVFAGSNGNLNASQTMQRQQMAVVLVRAINEIAGVDLVAEYKEAGHVTEIADLDKAYSAEQRNAIVALEYAGITKVSNFNPGNSVTRGQFASFLYRTINNIVDAPVAGAVGVKAINNTTVEVTFDEEVDVDDVKADNFKIEGLDVKNAVVKQTNKKVVVLTTAAQEADKEYTVSLGEDKIGTFKGIGAVVPTSIKLVTTNTQGKVGNQVTLTADVGVKAAGVPVTFNVDAPTGSLNKDAVVEVYTNADGIASYSYTQYAPDADDVTVYPTGAPQLRAFGTVYWGVDNILTIEEVTTGNVLANGVKKTYKVTFKDPKTGAALSNRALNVSFVENTNVAFNAISKATVTNPTTGVTVTPYQATTGYSEELKITTDSNGQATFVVSGTNTAVTPYVFVDGSSSVLGVSTVTGTNGVTTATTANKKWEATELTATAAQVKFEGAQLNHQITVERDGEEEAAAQFGTKLNGREYKVKVLDKDGKPYANGLVNIGLDEVLDRNISTVSNAKFENVTDSTALVNLNASRQQGQIKLNSKGEATVLLYGSKGEVGTPVVWIDQNTAQNNQSGVLEDGEPFFKAPISNFQFERVIGAEFKVEGKTSNQTVGTDGIANYTFALTNQSGESLDRLQGKMTYEIRNTSGQPIVVKTPVAYTSQGNVAATQFQIEEYGSITITTDVFNTASAAITVETAPNGKAGSVLVTPTFVTASAFDASGDNGITADARDFNKYVTAAGLTATFGNSTVIGTEHTGYIATYNTDKKQIGFVGKDAVKYAGETGKTYEYYGVNGAPIICADNFITALESAIASNGGNRSVFATYKVVDNVVKIYLENTAANSATSPTTTKENVAPTPGATGVLSLSSNAINYTQDLQVTLTDADLNVTAGGSNDTTNVTYTLAGGSNAGTYSITLSETGTAGQFQATIPASLYLGATGITVTYNDAKTLAGTSAVVSQSATIAPTVGVLQALHSGASYGYVAPVTSPATVTATLAPIAAVVGQNLDITVGTTTKVVAITTIAAGTPAANAVAIRDEINAEFPGLASVDATNKVVLTASNTTDSISVKAATDTSTGFDTAAAQTAAPTVSSEVSAKWDLQVTTAPVLGDKVSITFNGVTKVLTAGTTNSATTFTANASAATTALNIATALNTAPGNPFGAGYTIAANGNVITITKTAGSPSESLSVTISK